MVQQRSEQVFQKAPASRSPECFRYKRSKIMAIDTILLFVASGTWMTVTLAADGFPLDSVVIGMITYVLVLPIYLVARFQASTICVDDKAITAILLGFRWRAIEWEDIKGIRLYSSPSMYGSGKFVSFCIDQDSRLRPPFKPFFRSGGSINFVDGIVDSRVLLDVINVFALRYQIPIRCYFTETGEWIKEPRLVEKL